MTFALRITGFIGRQALSLILAGCVLVSLPILQILLKGTLEQDKDVLNGRVVVMQVQKKEPPKKEKPKPKIREIKTRSDASRANSKSFSFAPDLGVQGSGAIASASSQVEGKIFDESENRSSS